MAAQKYEHQELVYSSQVSKVRVYKCLDTSSHKLVAVKWLGCRSKTQADTYMREGRIQKSLQHPNICEMLDYFQESGEDQVLYAVIVTEWMDKSDLFKDITHRKKNEFPWSEKELWDILRSVVSALAYAQTRRISHRDIKPQNLFLNSQNQVKIGDFGSALDLNEVAQSYDLVGTPYFLSPILRNAMLQSLPDTKVTHNCYKSDVYSLGVTWLYLAKLDQPFVQSQFSQEGVYSAVDSVHYSDLLKNTLKWLLSFEESQRPDFITIENWLNPAPEVAPETPEVGTISSLETCVCPACFMEFPYEMLPWRSQYNWGIYCCSLECTMVLSESDGKAQDATNYFRCSFCKYWTADPWRFDCGQHGVCSKACGRSLIENTTKLLNKPAFCPECKYALSNGKVLEMYDNSEEKFRTSWEAKHAQPCAKSCGSEADRIYGCGHAFCWICSYVQSKENGGWLKCPAGCENSYYFRQDR